MLRIKFNRVFLIGSLHFLLLNFIIFVLCSQPLKSSEYENNSITDNYCIKGNGIYTIEKRIVKGIKNVELKGNYEVLFDCRESDTIVIGGESNILPHIKSELTDSTLKIFPDTSILSSLPIKITIKILANVISEGDVFLKCNQMQLKDISISLKGKSIVGLSGNVSAIRIYNNGIIEINNSDLITDSIFLNSYGKINAQVNATKYLKVNINGNGMVNYYGNPILFKQINGIGTVERK